MLEYVRVLDKDTGHKRSVFPSEVDHGNYEVLTDEPAVDERTGLPLEPEHNAAEPELKPDPEAEPEGTPGPEGAPEPPSIYSNSKPADLRREVKARNDSRPEADQIQVDAPGNLPELIAALEMDDALHEFLSSDNPDGQLADPAEEHAHG